MVIPLLAAALFSLSVVNSSIVRLPKQMQRSLAFLPGDWDAQMEQDAEASNEFRAKVWTVWWRQYFPKQPLFGRGFGFRSQWVENSTDRSLAVDYEQTVETGNIHNGFFASLDAIGIVGTLFFVLWALRLLFLVSSVRFERDDPTGFALRFLALQLSVSILSYWLGAVTLGTFLPGEFALAGVFLRLSGAPSSPADLTSSKKSIETNKFLASAGPA
jgi:O-antigen ligase